MEWSVVLVVLLLKLEKITIGGLLIIDCVTHSAHIQYLHIYVYVSIYIYIYTYHIL